MQFDSYPYIKQLKEQGVSERQAEIFADMVKAGQLTDFSHFPTKEDITALRSELKGEIKASAADLKAEILKWFIGVSFGQIIAIVSLLKVIH